MGEAGELGEKNEDQLGACAFEPLNGSENIYSAKDFIRGPPREARFTGVDLPSPTGCGCERDLKKKQ